MFIKKPRSHLKKLINYKNKITYQYVHSSNNRCNIRIAAEDFKISTYSYKSRFERRFRRRVITANKLTYKNYQVELVEYISLVPKERTQYHI